jgi:hypothetical protein
MRLTVVVPDKSWYLGLRSLLGNQVVSSGICLMVMSTACRRFSIQLNTRCFGMNVKSIILAPRMNASSTFVILDVKQYR